MSPKGITIRPALETDGEKMMIVHREAIFSTSTVFYSHEQLLSWAAGLVPNGYAKAIGNGEVIEVAIDHCDQLVAFCGWKGASVKGLFVHPSNQRAGIGKLLFSRAEVALIESGIKKTKINASLSAVNFYEQIGYRKLCEIHQTTRGGLELPFARMEKKLCA